MKVCINHTLVQLTALKINIVNNTILIGAGDRSTLISLKQSLIHRVKYLFSIILK
jgi:hypothetical protein